MNIENETDLELAIAEMESSHRHEGRIIIDEFNQAFQRVQPANIIKNILKEATASAELKDNILNTSVGMAAGYVAKILFAGKTAGPVRKLVGSGLMFGVSNLISNNPDKVRLVGNTMISIGKQLFKKESSNGTEESH
ncbi:hypothetical protein [Lacibacter sp. H407]|uniref:hypothetical protein n=1 Tax=Lacibacter sp. H407 TaxID=3133423 RepID=UPI0030BE681A